MVPLPSSLGNLAGMAVGDALAGCLAPGGREPATPGEVVELMQQRIARLEEDVLVLSLSLQNTQSQIDKSKHLARATGSAAQAEAAGPQQQPQNQFSGSAVHGGSAKAMSMQEVANVVAEMQQTYAKDLNRQCDTGSSAQPLSTHESKVCARLDVIKGLLEEDLAQSKCETSQALERRITALAIAEATKTLRAQWDAEASRGATRLDAVEARLEAVVYRIETELGSPPEMAEGPGGAVGQPQSKGRLSEWIRTLDGHVSGLGMAIQETSSGLSGAVEVLQQGIEGLQEDKHTVRQQLQALQGQLDSIHVRSEQENKWGAGAAAAAEAARQAAAAVAAESVEAARLGEVARAELRRNVEELWQALTTVRQETQERHQVLTNKMEIGLQRLIHKLDERAPAGPTLTAPTSSGSTAMPATSASSGPTSTAPTLCFAGSRSHEEEAAVTPPQFPPTPTTAARSTMPLQALMAQRVSPPKAVPPSPMEQRRHSMQPPSTSTPTVPARTLGSTTPPAFHMESPKMVPRGSSPGPQRRGAASPVLFSRAVPGNGSPSGTAPFPRPQSPGPPEGRLLHQQPQQQPQQQQPQCQLHAGRTSQRSLSPVGRREVVSDTFDGTFAHAAHAAPAALTKQDPLINERDQFISEIRKFQEMNDTLREEIAKRDHVLHHHVVLQHQVAQHPQVAQQTSIAHIVQAVPAVQPSRALPPQPHPSPSPSRRTLVGSSSTPHLMPAQSPVLMPRTPQQHPRMTPQAPNPRSVVLLAQPPSRCI